MAADPLVSAGARAERASMRAYLRRFRKRVDAPVAQVVLDDVLDFVLKRQDRYNDKSGGLGRQVKRRR